MILIPLTQERFALVDDEDADLLAFKWHARRRAHTLYAKRTVNKSGGRWETHLLHRVVAARMDIAGMVDHRNRHGLDCTRGNLRATTRQQNNANRGLHSNNTSGAKGVWWRKDLDKWQACVRSKGKSRHLGYFTDKAEADAAARAAREEVFGEFACHG